MPVAAGPGRALGRKPQRASVTDVDTLFVGVQEGQIIAKKLRLHGRLTCRAWKRIPRVFLRRVNQHSHTELSYLHVLVPTELFEQQTRFDHLHFKHPALLYTLSDPRNTQAKVSQ